mmetsp:Transcript_111380/g.315311  ORF Transcript_111380/g.315311 Transcript_111380/m.315311 type:complete len:226 (-) Transcript_111380:14-691(-)
MCASPRSPRGGGATSLGGAVRVGDLARVAPPHVRHEGVVEPDAAGHSQLDGAVEPLVVICLHASSLHLGHQPDRPRLRALRRSLAFWVDHDVAARLPRRLQYELRLRAAAVERPGLPLAVRALVRGQLHEVLVEGLALPGGGPAVRVARLPLDAGVAHAAAAEGGATEGGGERGGGVVGFIRYVDPTAGPGGNGNKGHGENGSEERGAAHRMRAGQPREISGLCI